MNSIRHLDNEINALDLERVRWADRKQDILDKAEQTTGMSGVVVQHCISSKTENIGIQLAEYNPVETVAKINRLQERINRKIDKLVARKERALVVIDRVENTTHRALLTYRYINGLQWSTVADLMNYTENWVKVDLKQAALVDFEARWGKNHL